MNYAVVTGNFDGMHRGHQELFKTLQEEASKRGLKPLVISFDPHTRAVVGESSPALLTTPNEKIKTLENFGLPLEVIPFTEEMRGKSQEEFARSELLEKRNVRLWLMGLNHTSGKGGSSPVCEFIDDLKIAKLHLSQAEGCVISSTKIRELLFAGDWAKAREFLGHPYWIEGKVVHGDGRGRGLGFPTANLQIENPKKVLLPEGVYEGLVDIDGKEYQAVANAGRLPSFSKGERARLEVHILNFGGDLYGKRILFGANSFLRAARKFDSIQDLKEQIQKDVSRVPLR